MQAELTSELPPPEHQAVFSFTPLPADPAATLCTVAYPSSPSVPFFRAVLRPSRLSPFQLPVRTSWVDSWIARSLTGGFPAQLVQPPLPAPAAIAGAEAKARSKKEEVDWLVGSVGRFTVKPDANGWGKLASIRCEKGTEAEWRGFGDRVGFPEVSVVAGKGLELTQFSMDFPEPLKSQ